MNNSEVIIALLKVFIMILPGFILGKMKLLNDTHTEGMSGLLTNVTYPCMVIAAMQMEYSSQVMRNSIYVVIIFLAVGLIAMGVSKGVAKTLRLGSDKSGTMAFMMVFGNTGFMGLPVINGLYGQQGVFYAAICDSSIGILMFTLGIMLIKQAASGDSRMSASDVIKGFANPCFISVIIGFAFYAGQASIPEIIAEPLGMIGSATSPLAMIVVGVHLSKCKFKDIFADKLGWVAAVLKLFITPLIALVILKIIFMVSGGMDSSQFLFAAAIVLESAMPCAMFTVILSEQYRADTSLATHGVMLSTILSAVTIPIVAMILQIL
ncbi:MAG: AEC family transporter [Firmicutes bacterium]|nr:AEC family transporter [Bacillota bacterium]